MVQLIDRSHGIIDDVMLFIAISFELVKGSVKGESVVYVFLDEVLFEMDAFLLLGIAVLLYHV